MKTRDVLISGAGIAGPALAFWLNRYGFRPTVVERAPSLRDGGYAVDFRGAAHLRVLERMGLLADIQRAQTKMGAMTYVDAANKPLATLPADILSGDVENLRGDLSRILYEATRSNTEYLFGDSITSLTQSEDSVRVTFERAPPRTFHLVVGADGLHSKVRALAFGDESRFIRDLGYYVSIFTTANHLNLDRTGRFYSLPGKTVGPLQYDRHDLAQQKKILASMFAGVGWEVPRLLEAMWMAPDFYFDSISQIHMDRWSSGRVVLRGDAGYCASPLGGNGTGLAVVGAYVLAGELKAAAGDHRTAFALYEEQMRDYVRVNQQQAEGAGWFVPQSEWMIWFRNLRLLPYMPWKGLIAKMARKTANAITLKDYEG